MIKGEKINDNIPITAYTLLVGNFTWTITLILASGNFSFAATNTFQFKSPLISFRDGITYDKMQQCWVGFTRVNR